MSLQSVAPLGRPKLSKSPINWGRFGHVFTVANGKGGVGKTTTAVHLGYHIAQNEGVRSLIIDLNGQGNVSRNLGFINTDKDDKGENLYKALMESAALRPVSARGNLDVAVGGTWVRQIFPTAMGRMTTPRGQEGVFTALARSLDELASDYGFIVIDTPPENPLLSQMAMCASRFVIVPCKTDGTSGDGLRELADDMLDVRYYNPCLVLLGVLIFGSAANATAIRRKLKEDIIEDLGERSDLVLETFINSSEKVAQQLSEFGLTAQELEAEISNNPLYWEIRRGTATNATVVSTTCRLVAEKYAKATRELMELAEKRRDEMINEGTWV